MAEKYITRKISQRLVVARKTTRGKFNNVVRKNRKDLEILVCVIKLLIYSLMS